MVNYGTRKTKLRVYHPGTPGVLAFPGQPYLPARTVVEQVEQRVYTQPTYKFVPLSRILGQY